VVDQLELILVDPVNTADGRQVHVAGAALQQFQQRRQRIGIDVHAQPRVALAPDLHALEILQHLVQPAGQFPALIHAG
jgi:hypothetical protein